MDPDLRKGSMSGTTGTPSIPSFTGVSNILIAPPSFRHNDLFTSVLPTDADIICGRTSKSKHPGNCFFRELIITNAPVYMVAEKKLVKRQIASGIFSSLKVNEARFMKWNERSEQWQILDPTRCREKISHALRDRVRELKNDKAWKRKGNCLSTKEHLKDISLNYEIMELVSEDGKAEVTLRDKSRTATFPLNQEVATDHAIEQTEDLGRTKVIASTSGMRKLQELSQSGCNLVSSDIKKWQLHHPASSRDLALCMLESCDMHLLKEMLDEDPCLTFSDDQSNDVPLNVDLGDLDQHHEALLSTFFTDCTEVLNSVRFPGFQEDEFNEDVLSLEGACDLSHNDRTGVLP